MIANIFLHLAFDAWMEQEVKPRMTGPAFLVRYADDFVIVCAVHARPAPSAGGDGGV